ncbi:YciI family protein [Anthocerotibacter panamensis]|uniref:YciI family protein n=1 Tax=Anthocerotibacter panamensis TaxID=2857077 RepID=UPI001C404318|nr:YciI family protein [Anthocerotibacter panamensis]
MQYVMLTYETEAAFDARSNDNQGTYWGAWQAYSKALAEAGVLVGGNALQPAFSGTTVRLRAGERKVQDGPYADTKEQLGGYFILEVSDLDTALDWAARCPAATDGAIEVRPVLPMQ